MSKLLNINSWLRRKLSPERYERFRGKLREPMGFWFSGDLNRLARVYGSDKWGGHWYTQHYAKHFHHLRKKPLKFLEIGIGGYEDPKGGGGSLRMWRRYFPNAQIVGLDYFDKSPHAEERIKIYRGDQSDEALLRRIVAEAGPFDIIIDDGSHQNAHVLKSFEVLFPLLKDDGIYVVEDTQTAYWPEYGGTSEDLINAPTSLCFLKKLTDGINYEEFMKPGYQPSYYDEHIVAMHFYHNIVFIQKGQNKEGSNILRKKTEH